MLVAAAAGCGGYSTQAVPATSDQAERVLAAEAAAEGPVSELSDGIRVAGRGSGSVEPDLALLELGVETQAGTVTVARADAAAAMTRVVAALTRLRIAGTDIQTRSFNIFLGTTMSRRSTRRASGQGNRYSPATRWSTWLL